MSGTRGSWRSESCGGCANRTVGKQVLTGTFTDKLTYSPKIRIVDPLKKLNREMKSIVSN